MGRSSLGTDFRVSLYPFNEGTNVLSKALMPVGNVPIINLVLDWVFNSGLTGKSTSTRFVGRGIENDYIKGKSMLNDRRRYPDDRPTGVPLVDIESPGGELFLGHAFKSEDRSQAIYGRRKG